MRWLNGITDTMDINLSKLQEIMKDRGVWHTAVQGLQSVRVGLATKQQHQLSYDVWCVCVYAKSFQSCLILCDPIDFSLPGSSVHGILQARILGWVSISFSLGDLPNPGIESSSPVSPALQVDSLPLSYLGSMIFGRLGVFSAVST